MNPIETLILAIIQAITEWLPISSSGHLALTQKLMKLNIPVFFDIILHVGTLIPVLIILRRDVIIIIKAVARLDFKSEQGKLALQVIVGSIPTAIIGFTFKDLFETFFTNLYTVAIALIITGIILYATKLTHEKNRTINYIDALLIGTAQGLALIPGLSRSGITISTGLLRKVKKETAFQYSFLLYIPAVIGATAGTAATDWSNITASQIDAFSIILALVVTALLGYVFLKLLLKLLTKEKFHLFAFYCWTLAAVIFVVLLSVPL